ncbi:cold-shock protein [Rhizobium sp. VS19-DR104.2]|uniref:cold-shock protein n=1 Tax=unclassified Rhizobium TaxID=2613769 RepID=UPI001CC7B0DE|nr:MULTISPECIES: cold-shock protein [unclassified Rhizobium]MBZ5763297.1 cold-shock protein [Rhizobium sp. VS19-DR96]MBZ5769199.1 cold-shock protein [Rhizobium sp. VS19-DR129.2]MBZ5776738.1 cold-shock protein [Rhizobium sp. VS19-DRK62.2]MBZ5787922.1 cold-shock protein [Rhizobium sp. VS19-DR121]MBZ5805362.1 cold-shock protein [Rhizobium sp. VS19-DR181]
MKSGTVKWFDAAKGFGFIIPSDGGADIYINLKVLQKAGLGTLEPGAAVNFSVANRGGKEFVEEVTVIAAPLPLIERNDPPKAMAKTQLLDEEELFEREWGLRRA